MDKGKENIALFIITYNRCEALKKAVESAKNQSYTDLSIWVLDNGSTDATKSFMATCALEDSRIKYLRHEENIGLDGNIRFLMDTIKKSDINYFSILCDDDIWLPNFVETFLPLLQKNPRAAWWAGDSIFYYQDKTHSNIDKTFYFAREIKQMPMGISSWEDMKLLVTQQNPFPFWSSILYRKDAYTDDVFPSHGALYNLDVQIIQYPFWSGCWCFGFSNTQVSIMVTGDQSISHGDRSVKKLKWMFDSYSNYYEHICSVVKKRKDKNILQDDLRKKRNSLYRSLYLVAGRCACLGRLYPAIYAASRLMKEGFPLKSLLIFLATGIGVVIGGSWFYQKLFVLLGYNKSIQECSKEDAEIFNACLIDHPYYKGME